MKTSLILFSTLIFFSLTMYAQIESEVKENWLTEISRQLEDEEYQITLDNNLSVFQSPNREQNLRCYYFDDVFTVKPRVDTSLEKKWEVKFDLLNIGRTVSDINSIKKGLNYKLSDNAIFYEHNLFLIEYRNTNKGIRQNFLINEKPLGTGNLIVNLEVISKFNLRKLHDKELAFSEFQNNRETVVLRYKDIQAWDANKKVLESSLEVLQIGSKKIISLIVDDKDAVYPIFIDPISTTENWDVSSGQSSANLGFSCQIAGDVNNDGFDDIVGGAFLYDNGSTNEGRAYLYLGSIIGPATTPSWTAEINQANAQFGFRVAGVGDVNGDGYDDVMIGANKYDNLQTDKGKVYLYYGNALGLNTTSSWTYEVNQISMQLGEVISGAGDVNGDGFSDVILGAPKYNTGLTDVGKTFIFHGSGTGLPTDPNWTMTGFTSSGKLGISATSAGDINNDGYDDIIYGEEEYTFGESEEGKVYLHYGSPIGVSLFEDWSFESNQAYAHLGNALTGAGDMNADGFDDFIVAAKDFDESAFKLNTGAIYLFYGKSGELFGPDWVEYGSYSGDIFGLRLCGGGDVNMDGFDDILISSDQFNGSTEGNNYLYIGTESFPYADPSWTFRSHLQGSYIYDTGLSNSGDVNGDGLDDILLGEYIYSTSSGQLLLFYGSEVLPLIFADYQLSNTQASCLFGSSVAGGGDINNDGYNDVLVGAPNFDGGSINEGKVFCYKGSAIGLDTIFSSSVESNQDNAAFGTSIDIIGDFNNDNYADIIVGSPSYDYTFTDEGRVFIYKGTSTGIHYLPLKTLQGGQTSAKFGFAVSGASDINLDGYDDILISAPYYDDGLIDQGKIFLYKSTGSTFSSTPYFSATGAQANSNFGYSLNCAGDLNTDNFPEVIVGEPFYDNVASNTGRVCIFNNISGLISPTPTWTFSPTQAESKLGYSVNAAFDVNGDNYDDIIIGQPFYDNGQTDEGNLLLFYGSVIGLGAIPNWQYEPDVASAQCGFSVCGISDFNNDGYDDVIAGGIKNEYSTFDEGVVSLFFGSAFGLSSNPNGVIKSGQSNAQLGFSVAAAGDINNDGHDDFIAGAPYYDNGLTDQGKMYCVLGEPVTCAAIPDISGISTTSTSITINLDDPDIKLRMDYRWKNLYDPIWIYGSTFSENTIIISDLDPCSAYFIEYQKVCLTGSGDWIFVDTIITSGCPIDCDPYIISGISVTGITNNSANVTWVDPGVVLNFEIRYRKTGTVVWTTEITYINTFSFTMLDSCSNYELNIRSNCSGEYSPWSALANFTTNGCAISCDIPTGLFVDNITTTTAKLHWNIVPAATKYKISYRPSGGSWINANATTNLKTISGLTPGVLYQYKIKTVCGGISSDFTSINEFTTLLKESSDILSKKFNLYPNPASDAIYLNLEGAYAEHINIKIINMVGEVVLNQEVELSESENTIRLDINLLSSGIYIFYFIYADGSISKTDKFIKE